MKKILLTLIGLIIMLLPAITFIAIKTFLQPNCFWQKLIVLGLGTYFLGGTQFVLLTIYLFFLSTIWRK